jgi:hypothetical protein
VAHERSPASSARAGAASSGAPAWMTHGGVVAAVMIVAVWAIQYAAGAFASERGLHSDEAAHFMNGLVLRDYLRDGLGQSPLAFARDYYQHYPKIAPFMWPPLFHGLLGLFLLPGWPPMPAAIVFVGLCTAWTAWRLYRMVNLFASVPVAVGTVGFFIATPVVIDLSSSVMIDILIAACALEAAFWLGRFAETGRTRHAAIFGVMTALACVAKGNGLSAVIAPIALVLVTGRVDLLWRPGLYVAAAIVVVVAAPPLYLAWVLDATLGDFGPPWPYLGERLAFYGGHVWRQLGSTPVLFAGLGVVAALLRRPWLSAPARHQAAALVSMTIGAFVFHLLNPHILSHERYITLALAPILGLSALGVMAATQAIRAPRLRWSMQLAAFAVMALAHFAGGPDLRAQAPLGFRAAVGFLHARDGGLAGRRVLIVSNEQGEGAGVTEIAQLGLQPRPMALRGSKVLAQDDWMGAHFRLLHDSPQAVLDDLEAMHVDYVVLDLAPRAQALAYWPNVRAALTADPARAMLLRSAPASPDLRAGPLRPLEVYQVMRRAPGPPRPIELTGSSTLIGGTR